ncbi:MAG TPA: hypothetical protein PK251_15170, partial [Candidatus Latescibacteria bacterium]|nr:hypothetical protein [Candidatus Latescibacterota bacterium]
FFGTPGGIPDFHEVSCFSWFHPNRDRYRDRLLNLKRAVEPSTLFGFKVSSKSGSGSLSGSGSII